MYENFEPSLRMIQSGAVDAETFIDDSFLLLKADEADDSFIAGETTKPVFDDSDLHD